MTHTQNQRLTLVSHTHSEEEKHTAAREKCEESAEWLFLPPESTHTHKGVKTTCDPFLICLSDVLLPDNNLTFSLKCDFFLLSRFPSFFLRLRSFSPRSFH